MTLSEFWRLMEDEFGAGYAHVMAGQQALAALDGRTVTEAVGDGVDPRRVWLALCDHMEVPPERRLGKDRPTRTRRIDPEDLDV